MSSEEQIEANRLNAQSSTGPKTPEGKARSSLNALKHGLTSAHVLAPSESEDEFNAHADSLRDRFAPTDSYESILVDRIIATAWRLRRALILERFILEQQATDVKADLKKYKVHYTDPADYLALAFRKECDGKNSLETLSRHETRIDRAFYRAVHELDRQRSRGPATRAPQERSILQNEPNSPGGAGFTEGPASGQPSAEPKPNLQNEPNLPQVPNALGPSVVGRLGQQAGTACPSPGSPSASPRSAAAVLGHFYEKATSRSHGFCATDGLDRGGKYCLELRRGN